MSDEAEHDGILAPFLRARAVLGVGVGVDADRREIKGAYRKAVVENPPDRDPEAFRRVREAFELLESPLEAAKALYHREAPMVAPPALAPPEEGPELMQAMLRVVAQNLDAAMFLGEEA